MYLERGCIEKHDGTRLAAMDASRAWTLLETGRYQVGSDGCISIADVFETGRYQVVGDGCISIVDACRNRTLPGWLDVVSGHQTNPVPSNYPYHLKVYLKYVLLWLCSEFGTVLDIDEFLEALTVHPC